MHLFNFIYNLCLVFIYYILRKKRTAYTHQEDENDHQSYY